MQDAKGNVVVWENRPEGVVLVANGQPLMGVEHEDWDAFALMTARFTTGAGNEEAEEVETNPIPEVVGTLVVVNEDVVGLYNGVQSEAGTVFVRFDEDYWLSLDGKATQLENDELAELDWALPA